jgi:hypothetical protein
MIILTGLIGRHCTLAKFFVVIFMSTPRFWEGYGKVGDAFRCYSMPFNTPDIV